MSYYISKLRKQDKQLCCRSSNSTGKSGSSPSKSKRLHNWKTSWGWFSYSSPWWWNDNVLMLQLVLIKFTLTMLKPCVDDKSIPWSSFQNISFIISHFFSYIKCFIYWNNFHFSQENSIEDNFWTAWETFIVFYAFSFN